MVVSLFQLCFQIFVNSYFSTKKADDKITSAKFPKKLSVQKKANTVYPDKMAHNEPSHLVLQSLQIKLSLCLALYEFTVDCLCGTPNSFEGKSDSSTAVHLHGVQHRVSVVNFFIFLRLLFFALLLLYVT